MPYVHLNFQLNARNHFNVVAQEEDSEENIFFTRNSMLPAGGRLNRRSTALDTHTHSQAKFHNFKHVCVYVAFKIFVVVYGAI